MTKKHFIALANALKENAPANNSTEAEKLQFANVVEAIMGACADVNSRFDRQRFARASGLVGIQAYPRS